MKRAKEKIAIVGMAFRFPGELNTSAAFWDALAEQQDLVSEIGPERWDSSLFSHPDQSVPGKSYIFAAGQISDIDQFDAQFFGISPREAAQMDPQQRILLELSWQALADGRQRVDKLEGSNCAVYIGVASSDYANRAIDDLAAADAYTMTGNTGSIASNRISYNFNLKGPSVSVDTACSSSLVAVYEACKSIWAGEADCAITGGVNLLLHPSPFVGFSKASMLSPTGRCKPFDASADGYVRSEGAGVLFLKPLADAERDGDPIHAVIVNAGVNSDGRTPSGISVPDQAGQAALLDKLYRQDAAFNLNDLDYIEAHGTGTPVGDPIEAASLGQILGQRRSHNHALPIGSIKGNLGHLETASGMAGIIKVIHCLKERAIPASNLVSGLNPAIDFDALNLQVVTDYTSLADIDRPLKMGVNSFGFGGTNAHVVVEEYQRPVGKEHQRGVIKNNQSVLHRQDSSPELAHKAKLPPLYLTANSDAALDQLRCDYAALIEAHPARYDDIAAYSLSKQSRLTRGLLFTADTPTNVVKQLRSKVLVNDSSRMYIGKRLAAKPPVVFVYSGNGCQWQGMARELYANDAVFANYIDQLELRFAPLIDFSIVAQLNASEADSHLHLTDYAQPLLFAIQVALTQWFADKGLVPDYVIGHSVGEVAAAWAGDALSLADAITVIVERSRAQSLTRGTGRMAAAAMSLAQANALLEQLDLSSVVEVACHNASESVVFAGALPHLSKVESYCENQAIFYRLLDLDYAFHSRFMDPIEKPLIQSLLDITPKPSSRFISSAVLGSTNPLLVDAEYWWRNIRDQVQFFAAIDTAIERGGRVFIELGSQPILRHSLNSALKNSREVGAVLSTLKRDVDDSDALQECYFQAFLAGAEVNFADHLPLSAMPIAIPAYPWQRTRHWYSSSVESDSVVERRCVHPLLGRRLNASLPVWEQHIDSQLTDYLADHVVNGAVVLPGAAYIELALAACRDWFGSQSFDLENIDIIAPMVLVADEQRSLRVEIQVARNKFIVSSRSRMSDDQWLLHCSGQINSVVNSAVDADKNLANYDQAVKPFWRAHPSLTVGPLESIDANTFYLGLADLGLQYGSQFQAIKSLWSDESKNTAFAVIGVDPETKSNAETEANNRYILHPVLLDACFQLAALLVDEQELGCQQTFLPVRVGRLQQFSTADIVLVSARRIRQTARTLVVDFALCGAAGELLAMVTGSRFKAIPVVESSIKPEHYTWQAVLAHRDTRAHAFWSKTDDVESAAVGGFAQWHQALAAQASKAFAAPERQRFFREVMPLIDSLIGHAAVEIFSLIADQQQQFSLAEQCLAGVIQAEQRHFFNYLVDIAVQDGFVDKLDGGRFVFTTAAQTRQADTTAIYQLLVDDYPEYIAELLLLASSLGRAKQFFGHHNENTRFDVGIDVGIDSDIVSASHIILENHINLESAISVEHKSSLVSSGGSYLGLQKISQAAVTSLLAARSEQQNIDLLELANYDSTLAEQVVPQLFANDCFHFFSADNSSVMRLQESLAEHTAFATTYLPSTADVYKQLANKRYDIVVLNHFLLSSAQPEKLLAQLQSLLKPGGVLVIIEQSENRFQNFVFGVEPSWWSRSSETSRRSQLISAPALQKYLDKSCQQLAVIYEDEQQCHESAYVLIAQTSDAVDDSELANDALAKNITRVEVGSEGAFDLDSVAADKFARAKPAYLLLVNEENKLAMLRWWQRCQQADLKQRWHEKVSLNDIELLIVSIPSPLSKSVNELDDLSPSFIEGLSLTDPNPVDASAEITSGNFSLDSASALDSVEQWQSFWSSLARKPTKIIDARFSVDIESVPINNACLKNNTALAAQRCDALLVMLQFLQSLAIDPLTEANDCRVAVDLLTYRSQSFPADAAVLGMARVAMNELTHLSLRLIDIDDDCLILSPLLLLDEMLDELLLEESLANGNMTKLLNSGSANSKPDAKYFTQALAESEILLRAGVRYANRLMPISQPKEKVEPLLASKTHYNCLGFQAAGQLKNLQWLSRPYRELAANQVAVQPKVAGLNFRDVMFATGLLPDEALENGFSGPELGMEFAGVVSEVGAEVKHLVVGDAVMGFAPGCFADHVVTDSFALVKKPNDWSFAAAASVPTVFFTAYYALIELAKLQAGERVLIHGAAGGVGLAAIQIARHLGAEVYATAGSEEKREFIQLLGAERVFDSRSLAFADQIMASTQGEGVDVILNSLAGEAIARNLSILRPFGRFLELGKRDFYADSAMGLRPFRNNISYFGIDADQLMLAHPQLVQSSFRQLLALFYAEELRPIPYRLFPATQVVDAFRYMQRSRQVGKVLIELESLADVIKPGQLPVEKSPAKQLELSADATYLVTGGSSGLGLATADWLVQRGAKHIAIVSRRGMVDIPAMLSRKTWSDQQVNVTDIVLDLAAADSEARLRNALSTCPPLAGIIHAATCIDDALLTTLSSESLNAVLAPKIHGAWVLHRLSQTVALDFFVLYSSATTLFGNPGQANYVAANCYLEALSVYRRDLGLPSLCLAWGAIDDVGFLSRNSHLKQALVSRLGGSILNSAQVIAELEAALLNAYEDSSYLALDWSSLNGVLAVSNQAKYHYFNRFADTNERQDPADLRLRLAALPDDQRSELIYQLLAGQVEKILCLAGGEVDIDQSLFEQGMDSLMGVELAAAIETHFSVRIAAMALAEGPTVRRVGDTVLRQMQLSAAQDDDESMVAARLSDKLNVLVSRHSADASDSEYSQIKSNVIRAIGEHYEN